MKEEEQMNMKVLRNTGLNRTENEHNEDKAKQILTNLQWKHKVFYEHHQYRKYQIIVHKEA